jgi:cerevisin
MMQRFFSTFIAAFFLIYINGGFAKILAPMRGPNNSEENEGIIPGQYIVRLKAPIVGENCSNEVDCAQQAVQSHGIWLTSMLEMEGSSSSDIKHYYSGPKFQGYSGKFSERVLNKIRERNDVDYVEKDQMMHVANLRSLKPRSSQEKRRHKKLMMQNNKSRPGFRSISDFKFGKKMIQPNAPWGLCRLSNKYLPRIFKRFTYPASAGRNVHVYVIDTGINTRHIEFEGRAKWGTTIPEDDEDDDGNGHGSHVAGIIAGKTYGVAKKAKVHAVKVLRTSGFGSNSDVIKGVEWVMKEHVRRTNASKRRAPRTVANMSLGGGKSLALEEIIEQAVEAGIHFAVAAGNEGENACDFSPAGATGPIKVGAINEMDEMAFFSNHGKCVDVFAPGVDIISAWAGNKHALNTLSGTSMATPHVSGVLALYLAESNYTPNSLKKLILKLSNKGLLSNLPADAGQTPNSLINIEELTRSLFHTPPISP